MKNRIARQKHLGVTILAIALTALLLAGACAPAPLVEEKTVEVASILPITGAAAGVVQIQVGAVQDYFRYFNEQEAIPGVSIKFLWGDTMLQNPQFYSLYEKFVARGVPVIWAMETAPVTALKERFAEDEVVVCGSAGTLQDLVYSPGWVYYQSTTMAEQFAVVAEYLRENWEGAKPPVLAFVGIETQWGYEPRAEGTKYAQSLGFEVLPPETVPLVVLDATTQLLRLRDEGADFVYMHTLPSSLGPTLRDAERLGLLAQMHFVGTETGMGESVIEMTGAASEGYLMSMIAPWFDETEVPGIRLMIDKQMEYHGELVRDNAYRNGWILAAVVCEATKRAVESVGYENVDSAAIKQALDNMKDFDIDGLVSVTYKDRPLDHRGITKLAIYEVRGGKITRVSDWREAPTLVPEGLIRE